MLINFTWEEFDKSIYEIFEHSRNWNLSGIYGIPRGGLCLAVALSHRLNLEILDQPKDNTLIVDDIYDSGKTLNKYRNYSGLKHYVLVSKSKPTWWNSVHIENKNNWVIFPWEDKENYKDDMKKYHQKNN